MTLGLLFVVGPVVTLIHELGHALAAIALGRRVEMLAVGHRDDLRVRIGGTVLRFGRTLGGEWSGFVTLDPESEPDEVMAIAFLGPVANLVTAPLFAAAAQSGATTGPMETLLWLVAAISVLTAVTNLVPRGPSADGQVSDGRLIQIAWAVHRGVALDLPAPKASPPVPAGPEPRTRWPFLAVLGIVVVLAVAAGGPLLAAPVLILFGYVALKGGHRTRAY